MNTPRSIVALLALFAIAAGGSIALAAAAAREPVTVSILNSQYTPAAMRIKVGDTVVWTNNDRLDHNVTATDGSFTSGNLKSGESFSHTFKDRGTFSYGCSLHPRMAGRVVVE